MMTTKKKLKRKVKALKKECEVIYQDYQTIGCDGIDMIIFYHDVIKLFVELDSDWFLKSVRAADLERLETVKQELKEARQETREKRHELEERYADGMAFSKKIAALVSEIAELKEPKTRTWVNGEEVEVTSKTQ